MSIVPALFPVACHTDHIKPGGTFVALQGMKEDGINYIPLALSKGAQKIIVSENVSLSDEIHELIQQSGATVLYVENPRKALAELSAHTWNYPAQKLRLIAVTGTKGKTTSCFILEHILRTVGYKTALISSVYNMINNQNEKADLTTPHPDYLHAFFASCVAQGVEYVVLEAAAQSVSLYRLYGLTFDALLFTNFDQAHGEFYASIDDYFSAKCALIEQVKPEGSILLNGDDPWCLKIPRDERIRYFGYTNKYVDFCAEHITYQNSITYIIDRQEYCIATLTGLFNVYNAVGACTIALSLAVSPSSIVQALTTFTRVPGRMEKHVLPNGAQCFIDKAHNPSSFNAVLSALRPQTNHLIVVFGAGGQRDRTMRPMMGNLAAQYADVIILTSDDPRSENPEQIIQDMYAGISQESLGKVFIEPGRQQAIIKAYNLSKSNSIIALLGKGSEEYQIIGEVKHYFSEREILRSLE